MNIFTALLFKAKLFILAIPLLVSWTGAGMNQAVLIANGGKFPVMMNELWTARLNGGEFIDEYHCRMTAQTRLNFLADYINTHVSVMSPGDILLDIGYTLATYAFIVWATVVVIQLNRKT